mgnify:CR=1 FL=1
MALDTRTGEDLENLKDMAATHFWPHSRQAGDLSDDTGITLVGEANGVWVEDLKGVKYYCGYVAKKHRSWPKRNS